jgi:ATP-binding cassette, subfamily C (CFTR/MRP), member 1
MDDWYDNTVLSISRLLSQVMTLLSACLLLGLPLAKAAGNAQVPWLEAIEERLAITAQALSAMKAIKMAGLAGIVSSQVANLRISEIRASRRHRTLNVLVFIVCKYK